MLIRYRAKQRLWKDFTKSQKPGKHFKELTGKDKVPHVINSLFKYIRPLLNGIAEAESHKSCLSLAHTERIHGSFCHAAILLYSIWHSIRVVLL